MPSGSGISSNPPSRSCRCTAAALGTNRSMSPYARAPCGYRIAASGPLMSRIDPSHASRTRPSTNRAASPVTRARSRCGRSVSGIAVARAARSSAASAANPWCARPLTFSRFRSMSFPTSAQKASVVRARPSERVVSVLGITRSSTPWSCTGPFCSVYQNGCLHPRI